LFLPAPFLEAAPPRCKTTLAVGGGHHSAINTLAGGHPEIHDLAPLDLPKWRSAIRAILSRYPTGQ
jgi:hypothetical protein